MLWTKAIESFCFVFLDCILAWLAWALANGLLAFTGVSLRHYVVILLYFGSLFFFFNKWPCAWHYWSMDWLFRQCPSLHLQKHQSISSTANSGLCSRGWRFSILFYMFLPFRLDRMTNIQHTKKMLTYIFKACMGRLVTSVGSTVPPKAMTG